MGSGLRARRVVPIISQGDIPAVEITNVELARGIYLVTPGRLELVPRFLSQPSAYSGQVLSSSGGPSKLPNAHERGAWRTQIRVSPTEDSMILRSTSADGRRGWDTEGGNRSLQAEIGVIGIGYDFGLST